MGGDAAMRPILAAAALACMASDAGADQGWSFQLAPYLWVAGLDGEVAAAPLPPVSVDAGFDEIVENMDIAFMLEGEARKGRIGVLVDVLYLSLSADGETPGRLFSDAELEATTLSGTALLGYRILDGERSAVDLMAGGRMWRVRTELTLGTGLLAARQADETNTWADPILAARAVVNLGGGFELPIYADIGGFGVASDLTWQVFAGVAYRFSDAWRGVVGYRHLDVDYEDGGFLWDVSLSGPIVGATFRF